MITRVLSVILAAGAVAACGVDSSSQSSELTQRRSSTHNETTPDFKTKDGQEIIKWVKNSAVQKEICAAVRTQKAAGFKAYDAQTAAHVANLFTLHIAEAEIVVTYAVEFACPELG